MPRPHREIPSQRLATSVAQSAASPKPHRPPWLGVVIAIVGWALLAYPAIILALVSFIIMTGASGSGTTAPAIALGLLGFLATLAMLAFPLLLGLAVKARRRSLWIAACLTGVVAIGACIYLAVEWFIPLGSL
ncbi:hypothetical protein [Arthrobacter sp. BF1]|uniref:hypothetical protein n=1 Tax=Arthrobacter sp. BF1 TaxID=2821145 RepID=UPI001C502606|nr:hypothetical protein [Arthrobacter sp. BF1]